jgi:hypothetical protein
MNKLTPLDFNTISNEKLKALADVKEMVLSTSSDNRVTSRVVSTSCHGRKILFLSWGHHTKCAQIRANNKVALCHDRIQIEGIASIKGDPLDIKNEVYAVLYKKQQPLYFEKFTKFKGMEIVEVEIKHITCWVKEESKYFLDHIDFEKEVAFRENVQAD